MAKCLTSAEIEGLLTDGLTPEQKQRAEAHLAACEKCRQEVEGNRADNELLGKIKRAHQAETASVHLDASSGPTPPESIKGYEILSEVHRGGQGVVYKAVQTATKRTVALKVLLQGPYASPHQRHRFEREIDLVASLQHPNIVTVYDSGVTQDQRHYFAMEYIHGQPLDAYLSAKTLSIDETLRLFQKVCAAVNYAHQRGVIHRDLKPDNIRIDAEGAPHVLDFGLAKAAGPDLQAGAPVTVTGEFMGTLAYASPEQTRGDPNLIDIRTDVYSLGVILYEMLTGTYPYEVAGQMAEVLRNIAEAEPKKPSTIRRQINDEVETVVLKALAKEKERRYQSADVLGRDIQHYLNGEPIDAKRDSTWYLIRKSLRRYRVPFAAAAVFLLLLIGGLIATSTLWARADRALADARQARRAADVARQKEEEQRELAEANATQAQKEAKHARREAAKATQIREFLENMLASVDPQKAKGADITMREVLDEAAATVHSEFVHQPELLASVLEAIAKTYLSLFLREPAIKHLRTAVEIRRELVAAGDASGRFTEDEHAALRRSERLLSLLATPGAPFTAADVREAREIYEDALGEDHSLSAGFRIQESFLEKGGEDREFLAGSWQTMAAFINAMDEERFADPFAGFIREVKRQWQAGDLEGAEKSVAAECERLVEHMGQLAAAGNVESVRSVLGGLFDPVLDMPMYRPFVPFSMMGLAYLLQHEGRLDAAAIVAGEAAETAREMYGEQGPPHRWALAEQAVIIQAKHASAGLVVSPSEGERCLQTALDETRRLFGDYDSNTLYATTRVARFLRTQGKLKEAEPYYREALAGYRRTYGDDDAHTLSVMSKLARLLHDQGKLDEAGQYYREALEGYRSTLGDEHGSTFSVMGGLARLLKDQGKQDEAEQYYREALAGFRRTLGDDHSITRFMMYCLAQVLRDQGKLDKAERYYREALAGYRSAVGDDHPNTLNTMTLLAWLLVDQGKFQEAERLFREALAVRRKQQPRDDNALAYLLAGRGRILNGLARYSEAEVVLRECLAIRQDALPEGHWLVFNAMSMLGESLVGQEKFAEGELLLLEGHAGMKNQPQAHDVRKREALERIVKLYEAWREPEQAAQWRAKLPTTQPLVQPASQPSAQPTSEPATRPAGAP